MKYKKIYILTKEYEISEGVEINGTPFLKNSEISFSKVHDFLFFSYTKEDCIIERAMKKMENLFNEN